VVGGMVASERWVAEESPYNLDAAAARIVERVENTAAGAHAAAGGSGLAGAPTAPSPLAPPAAPQPRWAYSEAARRMYVAMSAILPQPPSGVPAGHAGTSAAGDASTSRLWTDTLPAELVAFPTVHRRGGGRGGGVGRRGLGDADGADGDGWAGTGVAGAAESELAGGEDSRHALLVAADDEEGEDREGEEGEGDDLLEGGGEEEGEDEDWNDYAEGPHRDDDDDDANPGGGDGGGDD